MRLNLVINTAKSVVRSLSAQVFTDGGLAWPLDHNETLVIGALGETLQWTLIEAYKHCNMYVRGWWIDDERGWGLGIDNRNVLAQETICPHEFVFLKGILKGSICGFYYATSLNSPGRSNPELSRAQCSTSGCVATTIGGEYGPRHTPDCDGLCPFLKPDHEMVAQTIMEGGVPVLNYVEYPPSLSVARHSFGLPYVVVSHVWADGLGSPEDNSMVACQMKRLAGLVEKFSDFQGHSVAFWIDSACIPVHPEKSNACQKAIMMMSDIYTEAYATIVLSIDLINHKVGQLDYLEPAMRIAASGWMRRLWTFQEGAMSRNLYFQFADVSIFVTPLVAAIKIKPTA